MITRYDLAVAPPQEIERYTHGADDIRTAVIDIAEQQDRQSAGPRAIDRPREFCRMTVDVPNHAQTPPPFNKP